jgi:hypothetical protein
MSIYPNPAKDRFTVALNGPSNGCHISIFNFVGELILSEDLNTNVKSIDINSLARGIYYVKVQNENFDQVEKLIVQ